MFDNLGTGNFIINGGTLSCSNTSSCTYTANSSGTINSTISGTKNLIKEGTQTLTLSSNNLTPGVVDINAGNLTLNSPNLNTYAGGQININGASTLGITQSGGSARYDFPAMTFNFNNVGGGSITTGAALNWVQAGIWTFTTNGGNRNSINGISGINMNGGNGTVFSVPLGLDPVSDLDITVGMGNTTQGVTKNGSGIVRMSGSSTYTGTTTINAGTLSLGDGVATGNIIPAANAISNSASLTYNTPSNISHSGVISGTGVFTKQGTGTLSLTGVNTYTGLTTVNAGTLSLGDGTATGNIIPSANNIINNSNLTYNTPSTITHSGVISGTGPFTKSGTGTVGLSATNTYTGNTTIGAGTLRITGGGSLASGNYSGAITNSGTFQYSSSAAQIISGVTSGTGSLIKDTSASILTLSGINSYSGTTTVNTGTLAFSNWGNGSQTLSGAFVNNSTVTVLPNSTDLTGNLILTGAVSGAGTWTVDAASAPGDIYTNRLRFEGAGSTNSGLITVQNYGNLWVDRANGLGNTAPIFLNGANTRFRVWGGGFNPIIGTLTGNGTVDYPDGGGGDGTKATTLTIGNDNGSGTFSGVISNTGVTSGPTKLSITKAGNGTQILSGINTYSGSTTINTGTLQIAGTGSLGSGAYSATLTNNGTFQYSSSANQTLSGVVSGTGPLIKDTSASILTLSGANTYSGSTTVNAGTLKLLDAIGYKTTSLAVSATSTLQFDFLTGGAASNTPVHIFNSVNANVTGAGTVVFNCPATKFCGAGGGGGALTTNLSAGGQINISGGSMQWGWSHASQNTNLGSLDVGAGAEFRNSDVTYQFDKITGSGKIAPAYNNAVTMTVGVNNGSSTFSGTITDQDSFYDTPITGNLNLVKSGTGTLTLSGSNSYHGTTTANGPLAFSNWGDSSQTLTGAFINNSTVTVLPNSTNLTGNLILTGAVSGAGTWTVDAASAPGNIYTNRLRFEGTGSTNSGLITIQNYGNVWVDTATGLGNTAPIFLNGTNTRFRVWGGGFNPTIGTLTGNGTVDYPDGGGGNGTKATTLTIGNDNGSGTFSGVISNSGVTNGPTTLSLAKAGNGTQTLSGTNTFTGTTSINAGTLTIAGAGSLGSGAYSANITNNGTFQYSSSVDQILSGPISGTGALIKDSNTSTLTLSGAPTYSGVTTISAGTLKLSNVGNGFISSISVAAGTTLELNSTNINVDTMTLGQGNTGTQITGPGTINKTGTGWVTADYNVFKNFPGTINIQAGTLGSGYTRGIFGTTGSTQIVNISAGAKFDFRQAGASAAMIDQLTGLGSVVNTWSSSGTTPTLTVGTNNGSSTFSGVIKGAGGGANNSDDAGQINLTKTGTGTLTLTGANTYAGSTTVSGGILQISGTGTLGNGNYAGAISISNGTTLKYSSSTNQTFSGAVSGAGNILKDTNTSTLSVTGNNTTFTGTVTVDKGTYYCSFPSAVGSAITVKSGATLSLGENGSSLNSWSAPLTFAGPDSGTDAVLLLNSIGGGMPDHTWSGTIALNTPTTFRSTMYARPNNFTGIISGASPLTINSDGGDMNFNGNNTFSGGITIQNAKTIGNSSSAFGTGTITLGNANSGTSNITLQLNADLINNNINISTSGTGTKTIYGTAQYKSQNGTITVPAGAAVTLQAFDANGADWWFGFNGKLTGSGTINFITDDTPTPSRLFVGNTASDFSGTINLTRGRVNTGTGNAFGTGLATLNTGTAGTSDLRMYGNSAYTIPVDELNGSGAIYNDQGTNYTTLSVGNNNGSGNHSGAIGSGGNRINIIKNGTGTQILSGSSSYIGSTTVNGGVLVCGGPNSFGTGNLILNAGGGFLKRAGCTTSGNITCNATCFALDNVSIGTSAAYGLRKLQSGYTGSAIKVRRSSDNATQDIGFTAAGDLDVTALTNFVGANSGFIDTWYDQSGNGRNATQPTVGSQPRIVNAGTIETSSKLNIPAINFFGTAFLDTNTSIQSITNAGKEGSVVTVARPIIATNSSFGVEEGAATRWMGHLIWGDNKVYFDPGNGNEARIAIDGSSINNKWTQISLLRDSTTSTIRWSSVQRGQTTGIPSTVRATTNTTFTIGWSNTQGTPKYGGKYSEFVIFNSALGGQNLTNFESSQSNYWQTNLALDGLSITPTGAYSLRRLTGNYLGSAIKVRRSSDNSTQDIGFTATGDLDVTALTNFVGANDGFIDTWYDQSGNGRNATQPTTTSQPRIVNAGTLETSPKAGIPSINFLGTTWLDTGTLAKTMTNNGIDGSVFLIAKANASSANSFGYMVTGQNDRWSAHIIWGDNTLYFDPGDISVARVSVNASAIVGVWSSINLIREPTNAIIRWGRAERTRRTGISSSTGLSANGNFGIGGAIGSGQSPYNGNFSEFIIFNSGVAGTDLTNLESSQATYWGVP